MNVKEAEEIIKSHENGECKEKCPFCGGLLAVSNLIGFNQISLYRCGTADCVGLYMALALRHWNSAYCWTKIQELEGTIRDFKDALIRITAIPCMQNGLAHAQDIAEEVLAKHSKDESDFKRNPTGA